MELTQDVLLPVLVAAIVANTVLLLLVVFVGRMGRPERVTSATTRSALQGSVMSNSFVDEAARSTWTPDGASNGGSAGAGLPAAALAQSETSPDTDKPEPEPEAEPEPEPGAEPEPG